MYLLSTKISELIWANDSSLSIVSFFSGWSQLAIVIFIGYYYGMHILSLKHFPSDCSLWKNCSVEVWTRYRFFFIRYILVFISYDNCSYSYT